MNKSKKSKSDIFRAAVGIYLKHKSYVSSDKDKFRKSDLLLMQNKKQFVYQKMMEADMHCGNWFQFSNVLCITNNQHIVDQQFGRFSQFVESQNEEVRTELKRFYAPMLCHLYLELMKSREQKAAMELLKKYAHLVAPVDGCETPQPISKINGCSTQLSNDAACSDAGATAGAATAPAYVRFTRETLATEDPELEYFIKLIQVLSACTKLETAECDPEVMHFRASKYEIHTTAEVVDALSAYFEKRGHVIMLNLLYTWIHVHIIDNEVRQWTEENLFLGATEEDMEEDELQEVKAKVSAGSVNRTGLKRSAETPIAAVKNENRGIVEEADAKDSKKRITYSVHTCLQGLCESREQIIKVQPEFPRFIQIADQNRGVVSAQVDAGECHLVAGFNSSVVQLFQLNQQSWRSKQLYRRFPDSYCNWEINNCWREEEDFIENEVKAHSSSDDSNSNRRQRKYEARKYEDNSYDEYGGIHLRGHGLGVTDVHFSAHYPLIYSSSKDATVRSWRAESYTCASVYRGHRYTIWCVAESPSGMYMATGSKDLTARLWSLEREFPLITYAGHTQDVECLAFHPNGNYIATGSGDLSVRLWCVTSGKLMRVFSDCKQPVTSLAFSPDGKMLAAGGEETKIRIFDLAGGSQLNELKEHSASVTSLAWNSNGSQLASVCRDGSLRLWDVKKLLPMSESSSGTTGLGNSSGTLNTSASSSSTTSGSPNRLMTFNSHCRRLFNVYFNKNDAICCIGS